MSGNFVGERPTPNPNGTSCLRIGTRRIILYAAEP